MQEDEEFSYDGYLLFNEICEVEIEESTTFPTQVNKAETELLDSLLRFEKGRPYSPGKGYESMDLRNSVYDSNLYSATKDFFSSLVTLRYRQEEFDPIMAFVDDERREVHVPEESESNIFWDTKRIMLFRGSESNASKAKSQAQTSVGDRIHINSVKFENQFFLWMFMRAHDDGILDDTLRISRLTDAEISGNRDKFGGEATINESDDIKQSEAILLGILKGKEFTMLEGNIVLQLEEEKDAPSATLRTEIQDEKVHVKASKAGLSNATKIEKMSLATQLTHALTNLYLNWKSFPVKERYVPQKFIKILVRTCSDRNIDVKTQPIDVLKRQANLRNEPLQDLSLYSSE